LRVHLYPLHVSGLSAPNLCGKESARISVYLREFVNPS
jgi:hypothetical protein